ncbi:MAG TPA: ATP-binding cassette domain-containing protein [Pseudonocardiaceae bacterium]|jgi:ABC-2 type transport system ATP-binding protein
MHGIAVHGLSKRYGRITAVDDLTFTLETGRVTGFVGRNGAGKTTTLRMVLGLTRPSAGTATIDGRPYAELRDPLRRVGALIEPNCFHPGRTGRNALRAIARLTRIPTGRVDEVLDLVDLTGAAGRRVGGYSLGMRQRLALAAALLGDPGTLVLDEPANGLDPDGVRWLRSLIRGLGAQGRSVLVSSHLLAELAQTVDDVIVIERGRLVAYDSVATLAGSGGLNSGGLGSASSGADGAERAESLEDVFLRLTANAKEQS